VGEGTPEVEAGEDGVHHFHSLYGFLNTKADVEVTAEEIARCHLVLIGTASENAVIAKIADELPVRFGGGKVVCSDGTTFAGRAQSLGLVHYNPLAPDRLIFWVASDESATYGPDALLPALMSGALPDGSVAAVDMVVMDATAPTLVATRSFDSY
jgi:hypothetical protein